MAASKFTPVAKEQFLECLRNGMRRYQAIKEVGISRWTLREHIEHDLVFARACDEAELDSIEIIEDALFRKAKSGNVTAMIFLLCNRDPDRWKNVNKIQLDGKLAIAQEEVSQLFERFIGAAIEFIPIERREEFFELLSSGHLSISLGESEVKELPAVESAVHTELHDRG
jgi:hypothetical protein